MRKSIRGLTETHMSWVLPLLLPRASWVIWDTLGLGCSICKMGIILLTSI